LVGGTAAVALAATTTTTSVLESKEERRKVGSISTAILWVRDRSPLLLNSHRGCSGRCKESSELELHSLYIVLVHGNLTPDNSICIDSPSKTSSDTLQYYLIAEYI